MEKEITQIKEENKLLKEEITQIKEENKINKNLFYKSQNIQDTIENTMIIGYDNHYNQPVSWNIDKALLIPSFKESTDLYNMIISTELSIIMSVDVFKHLNKFNNFKTFNL